MNDALILYNVLPPTEAHRPNATLAKRSGRCWCCCCAGRATTAAVACSLQHVKSLVLLVRTLSQVSLRLLYSLSSFALSLRRTHTLAVSLVLSLSGTVHSRTYSGSNGSGVSLTPPPRTGYILVSLLIGIALLLFPTRYA
uniref:Uncharacterized protein n=1 Tax=Anopheles culicifacies TaxID=139723 RepID=A0A182MR98_9DIPT